jgi:hypothetical protein
VRLCKSPAGGGQWQPARLPFSSLKLKLLVRFVSS